LGVGVAFGFGVCVAFGFGFGLARCFAFGLTAGFGFGVGAGDAVWTGFVDVAPGAACLVGAGLGFGGGDGDDVPGMPSRNGPSAGSAVAEFRNTLRPFQLNANAVNATIMIAKAANASVERRDHLTPKSLNIRTRY
jgi:hypothetical protein